MSDPTPPEEVPSFEAAFEVLDELGRGGFGVVYAARSRASGQRVAAKVAQGPVADADARARTLREARLAQRLDHPNLVRFVGLFQAAEERLVLVYELVDGVELGQRLAAGAPAIEEAMAGIEQAAAGLDALHAAGLLHRDLKPENLMVTGDGRVRWIDLGLARTVEGGETVTAEGLIVGTPAYMAPELLRGGRPSRASDLYALGAVAFAWLTGRAPFTGDAWQAVVRGRDLILEPASQIRPEVPAGFDAALERAMSPDPGERPRSGRQLVAALRAAEAGRSAAKPSMRPTVAVVRSSTPSLVPEAASAQVPEQESSGAARRAARWSRFVPGATLLVGIGVGLWSLADPSVTAPSEDTRSASMASTPATSPLLPSDTSRSPTLDLAERMLAELERAAWMRIDGEGQVVDPDGLDASALARSRELLDQDPAAWPRLVRHLAALREAVSWLDRGGDPTTLAASVQEALRRVDDAYRAQGLMRPFYPWLYIEPSREAVALDPNLFWIDPAPDWVRQTEPRGGWAGTTRRLLAEAVAWQRPWTEKYDAGDFEGFPDPKLESGLVRLVINFSDIYNWFDRRQLDPGFRRDYQLWARPLSDAVVAATYAAFRSLREREVGGWESVVLIKHCYRAFRLGVFGPFVSRDLMRLLGPSTDQLSDRAVRSFLLHDVLRRRFWWNLDTSTIGRAALEAALLSIPSAEDGGDLAGTESLIRALEVAVMIADPRARDLWRRFDALWGQLGEHVRERTVIVTSRAIFPPVLLGERDRIDRRQLLDESDLVRMRQRFVQILESANSTHRSDAQEELNRFDELGIPRAQGQSADPPGWTSGSREMR